MKKIKTRLFDFVFYRNVSAASVDYISKIEIIKQGKNIIHKLELSSDILEFKNILEMFVKKDLLSIENIKNVQVVKFNNEIKLKFREVYLSRLECLMIRDILQSLQRKYFLFKIE